MIATTGHAAYPRGRYDEVERDAKIAVYGRKGLDPWPIDVHATRYQGNCMKIEPFVELVHQKAWTSGDWIKRDHFHQCYKVLKPRFDEYIATGNLSAIDFIDFGDYRTKYR